MAPVVHGLQKKYEGKINFVFLDADDPRTYEFQDKLRPLYRPQYFLLGPDGKVLKKFVGYVPAEQFEEEFGKYLK